MAAREDEQDGNACSDHVGSIAAREDSVEQDANACTDHVNE